MTDGSAYEYDFCLSFAAEERDYVEEVAKYLTASGLRLFLDSEETANLLGADLYTLLDDVYNNRSRYCVLFASEAFSRRMWTRHERRSAQDRAFRSEADYILPVRFDDTTIPGLRATTAHVDARVTSPAALAAVLAAKLGSESGPTPVDSSIVVLAGGSPAVLGEVLEQALAECRVTLPPEQLSPGASRVVAVITDAVLPAAEVVTTLAGAIERAARGRRAGTIRIAVHHGQIPPACHLTTLDVTTAIEAAQSAAVTDVLDRLPNADCAIVATERVHTKVIRDGRGGSNPSLYTVVKTATGAALYVRVPGYPRLPGPEPTPRAPSTSPVPPTPTSVHHGNKYDFHGTTTVGQAGDRYYGSTGHGE
ncbi:TIR domain-containing protein [Amycolatopsis sp. NBC_00348]|uniref:TIR domain-containing protein n=1 Tax=Amycolatopsis sp. NBC_00348 TaxID=2975956 RepID=UPI002E2709AE